MRAFNKNKGFTLIELLLVIVIIGLLLAVIVPRAWRANIDAKYGLCRQNCTELASWAIDWAETMLAAQDEDIDVTLVNYLETLTAQGNGIAPSSYIARNDDNNWNNTAGVVDVPDRDIGGVAKEDPEAVIEDHVPPDKAIRNPFNGVSVFAPANDVVDIGNAITGAIACGNDTEGTSPDEWEYYALCFQGTDNTGTGATDFHAGQEIGTLAGLRNGIFMARLRPGP